MRFRNFAGDKKTVANALKLNIDNNDIFILTKAFGLEAEIYKIEISLH